MKILLKSEGKFTKYSYFLARNASYNTQLFNDIKSNIVNSGKFLRQKSSIDSTAFTLDTKFFSETVLHNEFSLSIP